MGGNELKYVNYAFETNWIAPLGPNVSSFEEIIGNYTGVSNTLALSSGTSAIHLALKYFGAGRGDCVFCSTLTFAGSCNPILYCNSDPVFIDSENETWNMSPEALEKAFLWAKRENRMPKAVIVVDLYGQSADFDKILPICKHYDVPVIEDAAEALGACYMGKKCGALGRIGVFSFNGNKIVTTSGGGMVLCDDKAAVEKMRFWATQAREPMRHYEHRELGYNYRLSNVCAGIGIGQMEIIEFLINKKKQIFDDYKEQLKGTGLKPMPVSEKGTPNYWLSVFCKEDGLKVGTDEILNALEEENIEARPVWKPMHRQPLFMKYKSFPQNEKDNCFFSDKMFENGICLPSGASLTEGDQQRVIDIIKKLLKKV